MCGIAGIWNLDGRSLPDRQLVALTRQLRHRGPDGQGAWRDGTLGLSHTRLAILDLSESGHQPMGYGAMAGGCRWWITYNGEIYNFIELRRELEAAGHRFRTGTDTEVVLAAYAQWGEDCQTRFNGAWSFAIWDREERKLFLSRDRFGVRPLHYWHDGRCFAFASEMKAFLALDGFSPVLDPGVAARAIVDCTTIEGTQDCLFQGIRRLVGGHCLTVDASGRMILRRWWNTARHIAARPGNESEDAQAEALRELLLDACRLRLRSDVPMASALSGGLDSSVVHAMVARCGRDYAGAERRPQSWQTAFIASFPGVAWDERSHAEAVVAHSGTRANILDIEPSSALDLTDRLLFDGEDLYDHLAAPWLLYREMSRQGFRVSLDGHGGDELLAGYPHYYRHALAHDVPALPAAELQETLEGMTGGAGSSSPGTPELPGRLAFLNVEPTPAVFPNAAVGEELAGRDSMTRNMYADFHKHVLPTILRNFDRCSMAHGVEIRAPFLDWRVVCLCFALPIRSKVRGGFSKAVLRRAARGLLPEQIVTRRSKVGFASPLEDWLAGPLRPLLLDSLSSRSFLDSPLWQGPAIRDVALTAARQDDRAGLRWTWDFMVVNRVEQIFRQKWTEARSTAPSEEDFEVHVASL